MHTGRVQFVCSAQRTPRHQVGWGYLAPQPEHPTIRPIVLQLGLDWVNSKKKLTLSTARDPNSFHTRNNDCILRPPGRLSVTLLKKRAKNWTKKCFSESKYQYVERMETTKSIHKTCHSIPREFKNSSVLPSLFSSWQTRHFSNIQ